ncbi:phosphatidylinositol glycan anchor biosynthesis class U protein-like [Antedon mediterranea]|uniref:phosphatidylinositol glycan anchor biosynthesis class U protein-like n=1 Tax=Antedon mediterranea TaxID=105859 RepID=UPI003AF81D69
MAAPVLFSVILAILLRFICFRTYLSSILADRIEVVTPLTSWTRIIEGITLMEQGISPYVGAIFHETPLCLHLFKYLYSITPLIIPTIFIALDLLIGIILYSAAQNGIKYMLRRQKREEVRYAKGVEALHLDQSAFTEIPKLVLYIYLLNPFTIFTCCAKSTILLTNLAVALAFQFTFQGRRAGATLAIALAAYQSLYPVMLLVPCAIHVARQEQKDVSVFFDDAKFWKSCCKTGLCFIFWASFLMYLSYSLLESWDFLFSTYGFILSVGNLQPNVGLFWYFMLEMFEHFRLFFIWVFQINAFIYTIPLSIKFRDHPVFVMLIQLILISVFKSYPAIGDTVVYLALIPLWSHSFHYLRNTLVVGVMLTGSSIIAPIMYQLWMYAGSANANFFFAVTLVYNAALIFLATDVSYAVLRREFSLLHGIPLDDDGNEKPVTLQ